MTESHALHLRSIGPLQPPGEDDMLHPPASGLDYLHSHVSETA
jgi:hypothetical protein